MNQNLCTIYYADGRTEGPISTLVVRDLIQAGVLSARDRIAFEGENPIALGLHPEFQSLLKDQKSAGAVTAVRLSRRTRTSAEPDEEESRRRHEAIAQLSRMASTAPSNPSLMRTGSMPAVQAQAQQDVGSGVGNFLQTGMQPAIRGTGMQPVLKGGESMRPPPSPQSRTKRVDFSEEQLKKGAVHLRDKLLISTLPDILGVGPTDTSEAVSRAYVSRAAQISEAFASLQGEEEQLAAQDVLNILLKAHDILGTPPLRQAYDDACAKATRPLSFQNHVPFEFATELTTNAYSSSSSVAARSSSSSVAVRPASSNLASSSASPSQAGASIRRRRVVQPTAGEAVMGSREMPAVTAHSSPAIITAPPPSSLTPEPSLTPLPQPASTTPEPRPMTTPAPSYGGLRPMTAPVPVDQDPLEKFEDSTTVMSIGELASAVTGSAVSINPPDEDLIMDDDDDDDGVEVSVGFGSSSLVELGDLGGEVVMDLAEAEGLFQAAERSAVLSTGELSVDQILTSIEGGNVSGDAASVMAAITFSQEEIDLGPVNLRDKLLMSNLPDIFGIPIDFPIDEVAKVYVARSAQVNSRFHISLGTSDEDRFAVKDLLNILVATNDILGDEAKRAEYVQASEARGRLLSFQNHVPFDFAFNEAPALSRPSGSSISMSSTRGAAPPSVERPSMSGSGMLGGPSLSTPTSFSGGVSTPSIPSFMGEAGPRSTGQHQAVVPSKEEIQARAKAREEEERNKNKGTKEKRKKKKRRSEFAGAAYREEGDAFKGALVWSVGRGDRGLKHVMPVYITAFLLSFVLVSVGGMGQYELELRPGDPIIFIRNGILAGLALLALVGLRRENPLRFGLFPKIVPALIALPFVAFIGAAAAAIARFDINPGATIESLLLMLAVRAVGESLFFHGFITRTLLIEFKQPALALMMSAFMYGFYALTYATLLGGNPFNTVYAVFIYAFGGGFPLAIVYWQTRSVFYVILCQFFILFCAAYGGVEYATRMAG